MRVYWYDLTQNCPKANGAEQLPSPEGLDPPPIPEWEKLLCEFAAEPGVETKTLDAVCTLAAPRLNISKIECTLALRVYWYDLTQNCPKAKGAEQLPSPEDIEKLVCKFASKEQIEK